jgi:hypothetical protein
LVDFLFRSSAGEREREREREKNRGAKQNFVEAILLVLDARYTDQENGYNALHEQ